MVLRPERSTNSTGWWTITERASSRHGMTILEPIADPRVRNVAIDEERLSVELMDGRAIAVPLAWYPRLAKATPAQRSNLRIAGGGYGIHWPAIYEVLRTEGIIRGAPYTGLLR